MVRVPKTSLTAAGRGEAKLRILDFKTTWSEFQKASQTAAEQGEAELRILNFKTTWSEFQKASPTAAERGEAGLRTLDFKTTWSEFQKASQTAAEQGEAKLRILNFKTIWSEFQKPVRPLLSEAKPSYVHSILKSYGQSFRNPNCCSQQHSITSPCGFRIEKTYPDFALLSSGLTGLLEI